MLSHCYDSFDILSLSLDIEISHPEAGIKYLSFIAIIVIYILIFFMIIYDALLDGTMSQFVMLIMRCKNFNIFYLSLFCRKNRYNLLVINMHVRRPSYR